MKLRHVKSLIFCSILVISVTSISAEKRMYQYNGSVGKFVPELIDTMTAEGIQFSIKSVYNEKKDGKQGFVMFMKPSGNFCEVTFMDKGKISLVSIFSQNSSDMSRINILFLLKMKMVELGATEEEKSGGNSGELPSGWPDPGLK